MSEQEQEPAQEPEAPAEEEQAEPAEEEAAEEEAAPDEEQPAEPEAPAESDKEIEAVYVKLETRAKNYVKSVGEIMSGHDVPVALCELCSDAYPGMRWVNPADDVHAAMIAVSGSGDGMEMLLDDPDAVICERCLGYGVNKLPGRVEGKKLRTCKQCNGVGYLERSRESGALVAAEPVAPNGAAEEMPGLPLDDPRVVALRAEGYTVMPPFKIAAGQEQV